MTPERIAEINARAKGDPTVIARELTKVVSETEADRDRLAARVAELESEREQLADRAERADQTIANSAEIITARDTRIRELERHWHAIQGWTTSNLNILRSRTHPSLVAEAKLSVLDDLRRCLDHLTEPQPAAAPDRAEGND